MKLSPNFSREEFACQCGCGFDTVDVYLIEVLQCLRDNVKAPITINSACRCPEHNAKIGGAKNSQHTRARAADIVVKDMDPDIVAEHVERIFKGLNITGGIGRYETFTHIDTRTNGPARWEG